jgi:gluconate kinase
MTRTDRPFIVVSGLPGSGKSTLGRSLASALHLLLLDKDEFLEHLFETTGTGDSAWRRDLSRRSDELFRQQAEAAAGAVLVSFWHLAGMPPDSGTPTDWLGTLSTRVLHVQCVCTPEAAARRMHKRRRHPGHLDASRSYEDMLTALTQLSVLPNLNIAPSIAVDTSATVDVDELTARISAAWTEPPAGQ